MASKRCVGFALLLGVYLQGCGLLGGGGDEPCDDKKMEEYCKSNEKECEEFKDSIAEKGKTCEKAGCKDCAAGKGGGDGGGSGDGDGSDEKKDSFAEKSSMLEMHKGHGHAKLMHQPHKHAAHEGHAHSKENKHGHHAESHGRHHAHHHAHGDQKVAVEVPSGGAEETETVVDKNAHAAFEEKKTEPLARRLVPQ